MAKRQNNGIAKETLAAIKKCDCTVVKVSQKRHTVAHIQHNQTGAIGVISMSSSPSDRNAVKAQVRDVYRLAHKLAALAA